MKSYSVVYTSSAKSDILSAVDYIANSLFDAGAANRLIDEIQRTTERLKAFPESSPYINDISLKAKEIRAAVVSNYILFYQINQDEEAIIIIRFLHTTQDCANILLEE